jgi:16S rRNA (adenine1518-N6/adenine1519-N6)-dimethyltransferase
VDSGLVAFARREPPAAGPAGGTGAGGTDGTGGTVRREDVFAVVDAAFAQRRKTLRAALARWAGSAASAEKLLRAAGVDPALRGEALGVADFVRIAQAAAADHG